MTENRENASQEDLDIFSEKVHQLVEYIELYGKITDQHIEEILPGRNQYETNFSQNLRSR